MNKRSRIRRLAPFLCLLLCLPAVATEDTAELKMIAPELPAKREPAPVILGSPVVKGTLERRSWSAGQPLSGLALPTPVLIAAGHEPGPTLCLTGAVHGDELNGVEIIRRIMFALDTENLTGTVIAVPIVNLYGFQRNSRYLPDRRDLNRYFPGNPLGSSAARIAYHFFQDVIRHCDALIDIHTGSFHRTNLPQLRADLTHSGVAQLSRLFDDFVVLHSRGATGTLRRAASEYGIPAVTLEAGQPLYLQPEEVAQGVRGVLSALRGFGLMGKSATVVSEQEVFFESRWLRADQGGVLFSEVPVGAAVKEGDILGSVTDPITNRSSVIRASASGTIIGMALNQMVMPGFAAYHLGLTKGTGTAVDEAAAGAVDAALEPLRRAVEDIARQAAESASRTGSDPGEVSDAARRAAEKATESAIGGELPVSSRPESEHELEHEPESAHEPENEPDLGPEAEPRPEPAQTEPDEHPE